MMYLDLAELDTVFTGRWFWSTRRRALAQFRRSDHFGDAARPLAECVRDLVSAETGARPSGPVRLLTHLRYFGYCFNPISIYYCYDRDDRHVQAIVAEVTNTPWGERRCYVLDSSGDGPRRHRYQFDKTLHVSPFITMSQRYCWRCNEPGQSLVVHMDVVARDACEPIADNPAVRGQKTLDATLVLKRQPLSGPLLARILARYPFMTIKVIGAIHWQALRLWCKGNRFIDHPQSSRPQADTYN